MKKIIAASLLILTLPIGATAGNAADTRSSTTFTPRTISEKTLLKNSGAGQYDWQGVSQRANANSGDHYQRLFWRSLEPRDNQFNTWQIDQGLKKAQEGGGKYSFRIMAVCQDCSPDGKIMPDHLRNNPGTWKTSQGLEVPDWNSEEFLTQWEDLMEHLGNKYGDDPRLGTIDIGGYGNWGEWHSYPYESQYKSHGKKDISLTSSKRMIDAVEKNFPNKNVVLNTTGDRASTADGTPTSTRNHSWSNQVWDYALKSDDSIGVRNDCIGSGAEQAHALAGYAAADTYTKGALSQRWKTAPIVTEYCGTLAPAKDSNRNGRIDAEDYKDQNRDGMISAWERTQEPASFQAGRKQIERFHVSTVSSANWRGNLTQFDQREQNAWYGNLLTAGYRYATPKSSVVIDTEGQTTITTDWKNLAVAPTYDDWKVQYLIRDKRTGNTVMTLDSKANLSKVLPGTTTVKDTYQLGELWAGDYEVSVKVTDREGYLPPMKLANAQKGAVPGSYVLGTVNLR